MNLCQGFKPERYLFTDLLSRNGNDHRRQITDSLDKIEQIKRKIKIQKKIDFFFHNQPIFNCHIVGNPFKL